jgi:hypothetical protein
MGYELEGQGSILDRGKNSLLHNVQTDSVTHQATSPIGVAGYFPEGKAAEACS